MTKITAFVAIILSAGLAAPTFAKPGPAMQQGSMAVSGAGNGKGQGSMAASGTGGGQSSMAVNGTRSNGDQGSMAVNGTSEGHEALSRPGAAPPNWVLHAPHPASSARGR